MASSTGNAQNAFQLLWGMPGFGAPLGIFLTHYALSEKEIPIDVRGLHLLCLRVRWLPSLLFFLTDAVQFLLKKSAEKVR